MPLRVPVARFARFSQRPINSSHLLGARIAQRRLISSDEKPLPTKDTPGPGPNQEQLPHVSEEAAAINKTMGEQPPELEQGTPVQDILKRDPSSKENQPEVFKDKKKNNPNAFQGSRPFSTLARRPQELTQLPSAYQAFEPEFDMSSLLDKIRPSEASKESLVPEGSLGHKFGLPDLPLPRQEIMKFRYDPVAQQITMLLMEDGKLSKAQTNMSRILNHLRMSSPPTLHATKPERHLLPGSPPTSHLPLNPILYLTLAIDSVAPLLRMKSLKGMAGGGQALQIPSPLRVRQRRRIAVKWILDAIKKKQSKGSGKGIFAQKFADEIVAIVEGRSSAWEKKEAINKQSILARSNLTKLAAIKARKR